MEQTIKLGFIGVGNMASAIVASVADSGFPPEQIMLADIFPQNLELFAEYGMKIGGNAEVAKFSDIIVLAVKPQQLSAPLDEIAPYCHHKVLLSICAGVKTDTIRAAVPDATAVVRAMPNLPMRVGKGMTAVYYGAAPRWAVAAINEIFSYAGIVQELPEDMFDVATALCGSGPAYFYYLADIAADWAVTYGIDRAVALRLVLQTMDGAVAMMQKSGEPPMELLAKVRSKGGTTHAALEAFAEKDLAGAFTTGLTKCVERSRELSEQLSLDK